MTRGKIDLDVRQTSVYLSWPKGQSVDSGVQKNVYLESKFVQNYPSVDGIINKLTQHRPGSFLCKINISRAFCQLKVDPGDINLLGLNLDSYYIDRSIPCQYRHGSLSLKKVTDSIRFIVKNMVFQSC